MFLHAEGDKIILSRHTFEKKTKGSLLLPMEDTEFFYICSVGLKVSININLGDVVCLIKPPLEIILNGEKFYWTTYENIIATIEQ